jgi:hypothetical protein
LCSLGLRCYLRCLLDMMSTMGMLGSKKSFLLLFFPTFFFLSFFVFSLFGLVP